jgi:ribosome-associated protein YbcJ (S4-like RNA binding protein)
MITLEQFMKTIEYCITGGSKYEWICYGDHARFLESDHDDYSVSMIFDIMTQCVYEVSVCDYRRERAYRLINPLFKSDMISESRERDTDPIFAWDAIRFVDLEIDDDWLTKATAIVSGVDYDDRVIVPLDLSDDEVFKLMTIAHEQDITLNQLLEKLLVDVIERLEKLTPKIKSNKTKKKHRSTNQNDNSSQ